MVSPFPGMDPYLEGYLWADMQTELATAIRADIAHKIAPKYTTRMNFYTVQETVPADDIGVMYPDVEVLKRSGFEDRLPTGHEQTLITPATVTLPELITIEAEVPVVEIRDRKNNLLVTAIELLSPVNKRKPGIVAYRKKRRKLHRAGVHLLEIDLLRKGERPFEHLFLPHSHYLVTLSRAEASETEVWAFNIKDPMPVVPVPLKGNDPDVPLDLKTALSTAYERGVFYPSIDYTEAPPPPALNDEEQAWLKNVLSKT